MSFLRPPPGEIGPFDFQRGQQFLIFFKLGHIYKCISCANLRLSVKLVPRAQVLFGGHFAFLLIAGCARWHDVPNAIPATPRPGQLVVLRGLLQRERLQAVKASHPAGKELALPLPLGMTFRKSFHVNISPRGHG